MRQPPKAPATNIKFDAELLILIDTDADRRGQTRTRWLEEAARSRLAGIRPRDVMA